MTQEIRARASDVSEDIWLEKLKLQTRPGRDAASDVESDDMLTAFAGRLPDTELPTDLLDQLARDLHKLSAKLPAPVREEIDPALPSALQEALPEAQEFLAALLRSEGTGPDAATEDDA